MITKSLRRASLAAVALAASTALGCSFSYSSESSSDSSKSSSDSSRSSGDDDAAFREDVEEYTEAYVHAGGDREDSFFSGISDLARKRGVSDWEAEPGTWEAIGRGLAHADVSEARRSAYEAAWAAGDPAKEGAIERGYADAR
jgi:hypothetical protein